MTVSIKETVANEKVLTKEQQIEKYGLEINKVYNEDCLIGMQKIKDESIDMILCDLPYGTTQNKWDSMIPLNDYIELEIKGKMKQLKEDEYLLHCYKINISLDKAKDEWKNNYKKGLWTHYNRIVKDNGAIVLTSAQPFSTKLIESNSDIFKYCWIWEKPNGTGHLNAKKQPLRSYEDICVFYKKQCTYNPQMEEGKPYKWNSTRGQSSSYNKHAKNDEIDNNGTRYPKNVLKIKQERGLHPTQKPIELFNYLISTYTNENDIVLDNCIGSGTTAVSAIKTNRKFIGFENDKKHGYYDIIKNRIDMAHND